MGFLDNFIHESNSRAIYGKMKGKEAFEVLLLEYLIVRLPYGAVLDKIRVKYLIRNQGAPIISLGATIPKNL